MMILLMIKFIMQLFFNSYCWGDEMIHLILGQSQEWIYNANLSFNVLL